MIGGRGNRTTRGLGVAWAALALVAAVGVTGCRRHHGHHRAGVHAKASASAPASASVPSALLEPLATLTEVRELGFLSARKVVANDNGKEIATFDTEAPHTRTLLARAALERRLSNLRAVEGAIAWLLEPAMSERPSVQVWAWTGESAPRILGAFIGPPSWGNARLAIDASEVFVERGWCEPNEPCTAKPADNEVLAYSRKTSDVRVAVAKPGALSFAIDDARIYWTSGPPPGALLAKPKTGGESEVLVDSFGQQPFFVWRNGVFRSFDRPDLVLPKVPVGKFAGHQASAWGAGNVDDDGKCWLQAQKLICRSNDGVRTEALIPAGIQSIAIRGPEVALSDGKTIWLTDRPTFAVQSPAGEFEPLERVAPTPSKPLPPPEVKLRPIAGLAHAWGVKFVSPETLVAWNGAEIETIGVNAPHTHTTIAKAPATKKLGVPADRNGALAWLVAGDNPSEPMDVWAWTAHDGAHLIGTTPGPADVVGLPVVMDDDNVYVSLGGSKGGAFAFPKKSGRAQWVPRVPTDDHPSPPEPPPPDVNVAGDWWRLLVADEDGACWQSQNTVRCRSHDGVVSDIVLRGRAPGVAIYRSIVAVIDGDAIALTDRPHSGGVSVVSDAGVDDAGTGDAGAH